MIEIGRKKQPENLLNLLKTFEGFNGVGEFDSNRVPSLLPQEPPNCWMLPVVTLTSIAIALPNIGKQKGKRLLRSVSEGFSLAKLVEETLVKNDKLVVIRKAADICWVGVVLYMKWLNIDLSRISLNCKNSKEVLQELSEKAERILKKQVQRGGYSNWTPKLVAANSMCRISRTLLLLCDEGGEDRPEEELFERISIMIADILAACLTNLPHIITTMCHHNTIEKREKSVREAFLLLGKTEEIIKIVQNQDWPSLDHDKAASIEEWRTFFRQNKGERSIGGERATDTVLSSEEQLAIKVDS